MTDAEKRLVRDLELLAERHEFFTVTARVEDRAFHEIVAACVRRAADAVLRVAEEMPAEEFSDGR